MGPLSAAASRDDIVAAGPVQFDDVIAPLTGPLPVGKAVSYQKHMAHHLLPVDFDHLDWIDGVRNCFLIRDPSDMITSFIKIIPTPTPADLGLPQQVRLFEHVRDRLGHIPAVLDSKDVLRNPKGMLMALCERVGIRFDEAMLKWLEAAGLQGRVVEHLEGGELTVTIWAGEQSEARLKVVA